MPARRADRRTGGTQASRPPVGGRGGREVEDDRPLGGWFRFDKALCDQLVAGRFTANQLKIALAVVRYTHGHKNQRKGADLSCRWIAQVTQLHERTVRVVLEELEREGVVRLIEPARGRRPAKIAIETEWREWGRHSPAAPPLRRAVNAENLRAHQFDVDPLSARSLPHNAESLCGSRRAPSAGVDARTSCGSRRADSEEPEEGSLKSDDAAATADAASSSLDPEPPDAEE